MYDDLDPSTPIVVASAELVHRDGDRFVPASATDLMIEVVRDALASTGVADGLGTLTGAVFVPHGTWTESDPGRAIAQELGAPTALSVRSELGVLQHTLMSRAAVGVQEGAFEVAVVVGAENRWSGVIAGKGGAPVPDAPSSALGEPDEVIAPTGHVVLPIEIERNLTTAAHQYAILESAIRHEAGRDIEEHRRALGALWSRFAQVAVDAPASWDVRGLDADAISIASDSNRVLAAPYTKWMISQWNVDQAAALIFTTVGVARRLGIDEARWVFPVAMAQSNVVIAMPERAEIHRWPATGIAARAALDVAGIDVDDLGPVDLYSCFPSAVQIQAREIGLSTDRDLTVTGGMTFSGGPFNNYSLQGAAAVVREVRDATDPTFGLSTAVSGFCSKPSSAIWTNRPPRTPFVALDVSAEADAATERRSLDPDLTGPAVVVGATVVPGRDSITTIVVVESDRGVRSVAQSPDPEVAAAFTAIDPVGRAVTLDAPGTFVLEPA